VHLLPPGSGRQRDTIEGFLREQAGCAGVFRETKTLRVTGLSRVRAGSDRAG